MDILKYYFSILDVSSEYLPLALLIIDVLELQFNPMLFYLYVPKWHFYVALYVQFLALIWLLDFLSTCGGIGSPRYGLKDLALDLYKGQFKSNLMFSKLLFHFTLASFESLKLEMEKTHDI